MDTGYYMTRWLEGPPPWEDNRVFHVVNGYHSQAAKRFRDMTKEERRQEAVEKVAALDEKDKYPMNEELDQVFW